MNRIIGGFLCLFMLIPLTSSADYLKHFKQGRAHYKAGKHQLALQQFEKALTFEVKPGAQYFKALSLVALKRFAEAKTLLETVERHPKTPEVVKNLIPKQLAIIYRKLKKIKEQQKLHGPVTVWFRSINPRSALVMLDGKQLGWTPIKQLLKPGSYKLSVTKPGYHSHSETIVVKPQTPLTRQLSLKVAPVTITISVPGVNGAQVKLNGKSIGTAPLTVKRMPGRYSLIVTQKGFETHRERLQLDINSSINRSVTLHKKRGVNGMQISAYVTGGVGLVLLAVGGAFHGLAVKDRTESDNPDLTRVEALDKYNKSNSKIKIAYAMYGVGGAALITGIVLLVIDLTKKPSDSTAGRFRVSPTNTGGSLMVRF